MRFREFEPRLRNISVFTLNDLRKIDPGFHRQQLNAWLGRGYVKAVAGGRYILANEVFTESFLWMLANKLCDPSYISLESALVYHQVIPESVLGVTSVSSRKTHTFESKWGTFSYRSVLPHLMFGYEVVEGGPNRKFSMARLEKAILDYLYLNPKINTVEEFAELRWSREHLLPVVQNDLFRDYLAVFNKQALRSRVDQLMRHLNA